MKTAKHNFKSILLISLFVSALILAFFSGCGDRGGDVVLRTPEGKEGRFVDSPVEGLRYSSLNYSGVTGPDGTFIYHPGLPLTFSVGHVNLGTVNAEDIVTPIDLAGSNANINHPMVINIAQFLQSLDLDGNPRNGIEIPEIIREGLFGYSIDFSAEDFPVSEGVQSVFSLLNENHIYAEERSLVSAEDALIHLEETLFEIEAESAEQENILNACILSPLYNTVLVKGLNQTWNHLNIRGTVQGGTGDFSFFWDFDGAVDNSTKEDPGITYFNDTGTYRLQFTAIDNNNDNSDTDFRFITVIDNFSASDEATEVNIITDPEGHIDMNVKTGDSVYLPAEITKGIPPFGYTWSFDSSVVYTWDNDPLDATFKFTKQGRYVIKISCTDSKNDYWSDLVYVIVED